MGLCLRAFPIICAFMVLALVHFSHAQNDPQEQEFVDAHNAARAEVGVGPVSWDDTVAAYAEAYAARRNADCQLVHSSGPYGENLFWGSDSSFTATYAVNYWAAEKQYYDYKSNSCANGQMCGHYTQLVWAKSVNIGCARVTCNSGATFITCNYDPAGNYPGERPY